MPSFIQIIEFQTSRLDEIEAMVEDYRASAGAGSSALRSTVLIDRDRPNTFVNVVAFDSYESAMANSGRPETAAFAERLAKLCDSPPTFRNLDVHKVTDIA